MGALEYEPAIGPEEDAGDKLHMQTLGALAGFDFNVPGARRCGCKSNSFSYDSRNCRCARG